MEQMGLIFLGGVFVSESKTANTSWCAMVHLDGLLVFVKLIICLLSSSNQTVFNHQALLQGVPTPLPIPSMYGIFTYIYHSNQANVGKYTIHGSHGLRNPFRTATKMPPKMRRLHQMC